MMYCFLATIFLIISLILFERYEQRNDAILEQQILNVLGVVDGTFISGSNLMKRSNAGYRVATFYRIMFNFRDDDIVEIKRFGRRAYFRIKDKGDNQK